MDSKEGWRIAVACLLGALYSVLLWLQMLAIPFEWAEPMLPSLKAALSNLSPDVSRHFALAILVFVVSLPNTVVIAVLGAYTIRFTGKMRVTLYSSLFLPALLFAYHWIRMTFRASVAESRGVDPGIIYSIDSADFAPMALIAFLVYSLYLLLVSLLSRVIVKKAAPASE